jgi:hypothetical protein
MPKTNPTAETTPVQADQSDARDATTTKWKPRDLAALPRIAALKNSPPEGVFSGGDELHAFVRRHLYAIFVRWGHPLPADLEKAAVEEALELVLRGLKRSYVVGRGMSPTTFVWGLGRWRLIRLVTRYRRGWGTPLTSEMAARLTDRSKPVDSRLERADEAAKLRRQIDRLRPVFTEREWEALEGMLADQPVDKGVAYRVRLKLKEHLIPWC